VTKHALRLFVFIFTTLALAWTASAQSPPAGWSTMDIGAVGATGSATTNGGTVTVAGAGADVWGAADAFRFAYTPLSGDGEVMARVASVSNTNAWTKAGVVMRDVLTPGSRHAFMLVSPGKGLAFQRRVTESGLSTNTSGGSGTAPAWVKLSRSGDTFTASVSSDGVRWTVVGSDTISMGATIYVGVAVGSHVSGTLATATFEWAQMSGGSGSGISTAAVAPASIPAAWATTDIGAVGAAGAASGSAGRFSVDGAGADVWGTSDAFRFTYTSLTGDGTIVAQVASEAAVNAWTKAGVMIRDSLDANAKHAFMLVSPGKGLAFQRRVLTGGTSTHTSGGAGTAPYYVKLTRTGATVTALKSLDGANWTLVGSDSITMGATVQVGLVVSSHVAGGLANATFAAVSVTVAPPAPAPAPEPTSSSSSTSLRLLHWNTHHGGIGSDGVYDPVRLAAWIAQINPDVASLNEVDTQDQVNNIVNALTTKTATSWYVSYSGLGNLVISKLPLNATSKCLYASSGAYAPQVDVSVNGRAINVWSAHLSVDSASARLSEAIALQNCGLTWTEARIIAGDYNMQQGSTEYIQATTGYTDAWLVAKALGTAVNFDGNCDGCTRNSRIDYVFTSTGATFLALQSAQVFDTRDSNGVMPSDHKPLLVTYTVK